MPASPFSVHVNPDDLAQQDLAAALSLPATDGSGDGRPGQAAALDAGHLDAGHHGARDERQAARDRSGRAHARTGAAGKSRSYAFRRS
jgi:hypothetical protein